MIKYLSNFEKKMYRNKLDCIKQIWLMHTWYNIIYFYFNSINIEQKFTYFSYNSIYTLIYINNYILLLKIYNKKLFILFKLLYFFFFKNIFIIN